MFVFDVCGACWQLRKVGVHFAMPLWVFPAPVNAVSGKYLLFSLSEACLSVGGTDQLTLHGVQNSVPQWKGKGKYKGEFLITEWSKRIAFMTPWSLQQLFQASGRWKRNAEWDRYFKVSYPHNLSGKAWSNCREKPKVQWNSQTGRRGTEEFMCSLLLKWNCAFILLSRVTTSWLAGGVMQQGRWAFRELRIGG